MVLVIGKDWNIYIIDFFDKLKNKTENITTKRGVKRTIVASNGR